MAKTKPINYILLLLLSSIIILPIIDTISSDTPTHYSSQKITENTPKDTPIELFEVTGNGNFTASFNWPGTIGATCASILINFWSYSELSEEEQSEYGNLGHLRIVRCQERTGNMSISINTTENENYTLPMKFFFEVDNDQSLTGAIQDTLYLNFEFYQVDGFANTTAKTGINTSIVTAILSLLAINLITLKYRKRTK